MGWFRSERVTWAERAVWAGLVLGSAAPLVLQPSPEAVARDYVEAIDRGDVDAALGLTSTDFVVRPLGGGYYYRREKARPVFEYRAALQERWRVVTWEYNREDREVHAVVEVTNDAWNLLGVAPKVELVLVMRGSRLIMEQPRTDSRELRRALDPFLAWAAAERPAELAEVWYRGQPLQRAEAARGLISLLEAWRAEGKPAPVRNPVAERREGRQP
ncbi:MAG TPA: hypothetical protein VFS53_06900 [Gemmatimonadota bacterium]|nr:hypothetical protein [Gemmatimonadota bacterium]